MDVKVTDAEVKKSFDEQKKQSFPKEADYKKFIKQSGQTEEDILQRVKLDLLSNKIRDKIVKGKDNVSDKAIADFYNKNKARFAQPEKRDLRVVLTKEQGRRREGPGRARERRVLEVGRQEVLDRRHLQGHRRQAARAGQGHARQGARRRRLLRQEGRARRPGQDPVRLLRLHRHRRHRGEPADARRGQGDDQADPRLAGPAEGAGHLREGLHEALEGEDRVLRGLQDHGLQERSEGHADPVGGRSADGRHGAARLRASTACTSPRSSTSRNAAPGRRFAFRKLCRRWNRPATPSRVSTS